ncbi:hypothetical protein KSP39_PZI009468 [Platanthera zijinensis]|uniref:Uncharacterized protein n=1 Tax=Platanthera zijinensis TaxID=2320716 RepID=A0AAP0BLE4_9ASPA
MPVQINPNSVAIIIVYLSFLRSEDIFDLAVFKRIFSIGATKDAIVFFSNHPCTVAGTVNKVHRRTEQFVFVSGPVGDILFAPLQLPDSFFSHPHPGGSGQGTLVSLCRQEIRCCLLAA